MLAVEAKMQKPGDYLGRFGILNRGGLVFIIFCVLFGFLGFWRYGHDVQATVTLNIPQNEV